MILEATCHECGATVMVESESAPYSRRGGRVNLGRLDLLGEDRICVIMPYATWVRLVRLEIGLTHEEEKSR